MASPVVIAPVGDLDIFAARSLAPALNQAVGNPGGLVVDLTRVTFLDSVALGTILQAHTRMDRQGRTMTIVAPAGGPAAGILELSGLSARLSVWATRDEALAAAEEREAAGGATA